MTFDILTLFPEAVEAMLGISIIGRARKAGLLAVKCHQIRDYTEDKHRNVDDTPAGGGMGMVMAAQPIYDCYRHAVADAPEGERRRVIYLSPRGQHLTHALAAELSACDRLVLLCGHYEGFDERILEEADLRLSIGDFVLTGGELPALCVMDAVARFIPGVLGKQVSAEEDSFHHSLLEYPQYTRPVAYRGKSVPELLLSGDHAKIGQWRRKESLRATCRYRPELLRSMQWQKGDGKLFLAMKEEEKEKSQGHRED